MGIYDILFKSLLIALCFCLVILTAPIWPLTPKELHAVSVWAHCIPILMIKTFLFESVASIFHLYDTPWPYQLVFLFLFLLFIPFDEGFMNKLKNVYPLCFE
jgi:hypothetical protein